jgi:hypothetical protein
MKIDEITFKKLHTIYEDMLLGNIEYAHEELGKIINNKQLTLTDVVSTLCWHTNCKNIKMDAHFACEKHYKEAMNKT